ncbi:MAG: dephospho-CoA kinase [Acidobacteriia bacterium]|nr:dephospho-CoA kinase [Terriglobia bacterium]
MRRIGLTGGIACGKTTVCRFFEALGAGIVSADEVAHQIVQPGGEAYLRIVEVFGSAILNEDRTINRSALGALVFNSCDLRLKLNEITHPIIIRRSTEMMEDMARKHRYPVSIVDAALMVESGSYKRFEKLIVVWCTEAQQIERIRSRWNFSEHEARLRISAQMPLSEKRRYADYEIDTSGTQERTKELVRALYHTLLSLPE